MGDELTGELSRVQPGDHICLIYESPDEQMAAAVPFVKDGLARSERCVYIVDERTAAEVEAALAAAGVDVPRAVEAGALVLATQRETYLRGGVFDPPAMVAFLDESTEQALAEGYAALRVTGEMTWALGAEVGCDRLVEYEARLNQFFPGSRALAICQYNKARFGPAVVRSVLRTHPVAILGDQVCPNLYYEPPEVVLNQRPEADGVNWMIAQLKRARAAEQDLQVAHGRAEAAAERLRRLQSLTEAALAHVSLEHLLGELLARVQQLLEADTAAALLLEGEDLVVRAAVGLEEAVERAVRIPVGKGFAGRVAAERRPVIIDDVDQAEVLNPVLREKGVKSLLGAPLLVEGRVLGVLHVGTLTPRSFTEEEGRLLHVAADRVGLAIEHARMFESERAARQEAEAALRLRDEFLSVAAHELKTPIAGLQLAVQYLRRLLDKGAAPEPGRLRQSLGAVNEKAAKASRLVAQLLETSRLELGRLLLELRVVDLSDSAAGVVEQAQTGTSRHELALSAAPEAHVFADALRLEQVLANLLDNAIKFSPKGGRIEVEVSAPEEGTVQLAVRDRGLGIPPEHREHIFDRFHQAHAREHRSGLGLGLHVSRGIVELHGGRIWAEFPPDGGTRFVVSLPTGVAAVPARRKQVAVA
jgi:signal transduction histidine kinase